MSFRQRNWEAVANISPDLEKREIVSHFKQLESFFHFCHLTSYFFILAKIWSTGAKWIKGSGYPVYHLLVIDSNAAQLSGQHSLPSIGCLVTYGE